MTDYQVTWSLKSPLETELQSDTIFGHLCWAMLRRQGVDALQEWLSDIEANRSFALSSAFPLGYLPVPILTLSEVDKKRVHDLEEKNFIERKELKKRQWLSWNAFLQVRQGYAYHKLIAIESREQNTLIEKFPLERKTVSVLHASINRLTGTTGEKGSGSLYISRETFYPPDARFWSFVRTTMPQERLQDLFTEITRSGFGRNKHTGKGWFDRIDVKPFVVPPLPQANAWLNLSEMVPDEHDPTTAFYELNTKYGKLGGQYAVSDNPFKYPLVQLRPGSVFLERCPVGRVVRGVHPERPEVVQNCLSYSLPFRREEEEQ